jgi:SEC-C motif-containing protein
MRARYSAFARRRVEFITATLHPSRQGTHDERETREWSHGSEWLNLEVLNTDEGGEDDARGSVEFVATYRTDGEEIRHHEVAEFRKKDGKWLFYDGKVRGGDPIRREETKVGRNDPCPCGSGKKFKKCCANK